MNISVLVLAALLGTVYTAPALRNSNNKFLAQTNLQGPGHGGAKPVETTDSGDTPTDNSEEEPDEVIVEPDLPDEEPLEEEPLPEPAPVEVDEHVDDEEIYEPISVDEDDLEGDYTFNETA